MEDDLDGRAPKKPRLTCTFHTAQNELVPSGDYTGTVDAATNQHACYNMCGQVHTDAPWTHQSDSVSAAVQSTDVTTNKVPEAPSIETEKVCFGMLASLPIILCGSSSDTSYRDVAVVIEGSDIVSTMDRPRLIARVDERLGDILRKLSERAGLEMQAYITYLASHTPRVGLKYQTFGTKSALNVIVYGWPTLSDVLGSFLQACELYLQDPRNCDRDVPYQNPHKLFNTEMSTFQLDHASVLKFDRYNNAADILSELEYTDVLGETETPNTLRTTLYSHQKQALTFMRQREQGWKFQGVKLDVWSVQETPHGGIEYVNNLIGRAQYESPPQFRGGILADQMGLGKSLTAIALVCSDIENHPNSHLTGGRTGSEKCTLLVVRASLMETWKAQLRRHVHGDRFIWKVHYDKDRIKSSHDMDGCNLVLTSYHTLALEHRKHEDLPSPIIANVWRRIILDEAHDVRDSNSKLSKAVCAVKAGRRWAITGTPIQNSIMDVSGLFKFLRMSPYELPEDFRKAVKQVSQHSTYHDGPERLRKLFQCVMLRRSIGTVSLPTREDVVCRLDFDADEQALYDDVKGTGQRRDAGTGFLTPNEGSINILHLINKLRTICNLGLLFTQTHSEGRSRSTTPDGSWDEENAQKSFNSLLMAGQARCSLCENDLSVGGTEAADNVVEDELRPRLWSCSWMVCSNCWDKPEGKFCRCTTFIQHPHAPVTTMSSNTSLDIVDTTNDRYMPTKVRALLTDLEQNVHHEKCVVFSFWTTTLDVVQRALDQRGIPFIRFDGTQAKAKRSSALDRFAKQEHVRVALLTISCGGVGLDLTSASRAYLMEPHWNPAVEDQALARIYRMGQKRPVTNIRFVMRGSFEEQILQLQDDKEALAKGLLSNLDSNTQQHNAAQMNRLRQLLLG